MRHYTVELTGEEDIMAQAQHVLLKTSFIGTILGAATAYALSHRKHHDGNGTYSNDVTAALREEQEQMRMRRESKRQMPVLTTWEREL